MTKDANEQWRDVRDYEGIYQVSSFGNVRSSKRLLQTNPRPDGYIKVDLYKKKKRKTHYVHRMVADAFLGKIPQDRHINHINGVRSDNGIINLEYVLVRENHLHFRISRRPPELLGVHAPKRKVKKYASSIRIGDKHKHLGCFDTAQAAHNAYVSAAKEIYGELKYLEGNYD